jgi:hypothetical protein
MSPCIGTRSKTAVANRDGKSMAHGFKDALSSYLQKDGIFSTIAEKVPG